MGGHVFCIVNVEPHKDFKRNNADLTIEKKITLLEALTGASFPITHLDGRKLLVKTKPGEVIAPAATKQPEWQVFADTRSDGEDVAKCKCPSPDKLKEVCKEKGFAGFVFDSKQGMAYFRQEQKELTQNKRSGKDAKGWIVYVTPDEEKEKAFRMRKCVKGEGLPVFKHPMMKGNLFIEIEIDFPESISQDAAATLRKALPGPSMDIDQESDEHEHHTLSDMDPKDSEKEASHAYESDDDSDAGGGGPGGVQCAQQ